VALDGQEPVSLKLYDISLAGFSVINTSSEISVLMAPDAHFEHGKIILEGTGEGTVSFEIRSKYNINPEISETADRIEKIGCKFAHITAAFEDTIQRHIQSIEMEIRQKT
jgi:c-di-GMP-binding flagellar brake protein YcgR